MVREMAVEARFRERIRQEREQRKWSQAAVADMLSDKGIKAIYPMPPWPRSRMASEPSESTRPPPSPTFFRDVRRRPHGSQPRRPDQRAGLPAAHSADTVRQSYQQVYGSVHVIRELLEDLRWSSSTPMNSSYWVRHLGASVRIIRVSD